MIGLDVKSTYVITPPERVTLPILGGPARFPVNRVFCIGRNYADHAREMGHDPNRELPFFFLKPASTIRCDGRFAYPAISTNVHHEVEMIVALGSGGWNIDPEGALHHVFGYGVGLDMTCRDLQDSAKKHSRPWDISKGFDNSAPCSMVVPVARCGHLTSGAISLSVNDEVRQTGNLNQMIWSVPEMISILSQSFRLGAGDIIMTGTPAGVGPVSRGDVMEAGIAGLVTFSVAVE